MATIAESGVDEMKEFEHGLKEVFKGSLSPLKYKILEKIQPFVQFGGGRLPKSDIDIF